MIFKDFFYQATSQHPYEYQIRLATENKFADLLEAPTGSGKTEAIILAWLWRRRYAPLNIRQNTPRRLVYCLPMRVLVEQTRDRVIRWMQNLGYSDQIKVHVLMGGEDAEDWDLYPEVEAIFIGTQDMLISRALNRGYAISRARWPLPYALLNNDCLWVFDEVQLMGSGLTTTSQLAAFRNQFKTIGSCLSLWVSATLRKEWLATVDFRGTLDTLYHQTLSSSEWDVAPLSQRLNAKKTLSQAKAIAGDSKHLADEIIQVHKEGTLTLVVVNTVDRACALYKELKSRYEKDKKIKDKPTKEIEFLLLHSRFRLFERKKKIEKLLELQDLGGIVVATQVIEAGVDISARVLFTEIAPWASLVQRFGRCNRKGEFQQAFIYWIDLWKIESDQSKTISPLPYQSEEIDESRQMLRILIDGSPCALRDHLQQLSQEQLNQLYPAIVSHVLRKRENLELFHTVSDLSGNDLDISRFIRDIDEHDAQVFWRKIDYFPNNPMQSMPRRDELCAVPVNKLRDFQRKKKALYQWDFLDGMWKKSDNVVIGQVYMLSDAAGGYDAEIGWNPDSSCTDIVSYVTQPVDNEAHDSDLQLQTKHWQTLAEHTEQVVAELIAILTSLADLLPDEIQQILQEAARWHDWGKAHIVFQNALLAPSRNQPDKAPPIDLGENDVWAKSAHPAVRYGRKHFRHELPSVLGMLQLGKDDLMCYIVAAHHGKVRSSIRSMPDESSPSNAVRFARGVYENDQMPDVHLGAGVIAPAITLSLAPMELGLQDGKPSWTERVLKLLAQHGPYRLAFYEMLLCAADRRASAKAGG